MNHTNLFSGSEDSKNNEVERLLTSLNKEIKFDIMWKDDLIASISIMVWEQKVTIVRYLEGEPWEQFGKEHITVDDVLSWLEWRCVPKDRHNIKLLLEEMGLTTYSVWDITRITRGQLWDDFIWIRYEGDNVNYEQISLRNN